MNRLDTLIDAALVQGIELNGLIFLVPNYLERNVYSSISKWNLLSFSTCPLWNTRYRDIPFQPLEDEDYLQELLLVDRQWFRKGYLMTSWTVCR